MARHVHMKISFVKFARNYLKMHIICAVKMHISDYRHALKACGHEQKRFHYLAKLLPQTALMQEVSVPKSWA